ncbi:MAG: bifunctional hydroxymethylpyrimidine kinase/phosphomethylpyrimidine kinase [Candidatus Poribacteria bacterium]|nr:bifunctional hydroxymethylpyrimidine kinase/phosphomethylpyrimidine kinase [Candidatus Poribacteria bacterium]
MKAILTIAGSDSGGGAGIQGDIKAISANGGYAMSVITAITAQNTVAVTDAFDLPTSIIRAQLDAVYDDFEVAAVKTGMLSSVEIIETVAAALERYGARNLVVDPVMISKSGYALLRDDAIDAVKTRLLPLARVVTPNAHEAELLAGITVRTLDDAREAARRIREYGCEAVVVKGGHLEDTRESVDVLFDGETFREFRAERIDTPHTHGTGCAYSAALATFLGRGDDLPTAVEKAKAYITGAIRHAPGLGRGHGPTHHFWNVR